jgi:hypothetical protein
MVEDVLGEFRDPVLLQRPLGSLLRRQVGHLVGIEGEQPAGCRRRPSGSDVRNHPPAVQLRLEGEPSSPTRPLEASIGS